MDDFVLKYKDIQISTNLCLIKFQKYFYIHGKTCLSYVLPDPINYNCEINNDILDISNETKLANEFYKTLNVDQKNVVDTIMKKINNFQSESKNGFFIMFYL